MIRERVLGWVIERLIRFADGRIGVMVRERATVTGEVTVTVLEDGAVVHRETVTNRVTEGLDELRAVALDPSGPDVADVLEGFEVGTDDTAPQYTNEDINNRVHTADIVSTDVDGTDLNINAFLDTNEANEDDDLAEGGLRSREGRLLNHATYTPFDKSAGREVLYEITLSFDSSGA